VTLTSVEKYITEGGCECSPSAKIAKHQERVYTMISTMNTKQKATKRCKNMIRIKLDEYLEKHNISLYWLAKTTGIRYATLLAIKNNENERLNLNYLDTIMSVLNIDDMNIVLEQLKDN